MIGPNALEFSSVCKNILVSSTENYRVKYSFLNSETPEHIYWSKNRIFVTLPKVPRISLKTRNTLHSSES